MKNKKKITVRSWVHSGDELVEVESLTIDEKAKFATALKIQYLNALFSGDAVFYQDRECKNAI